MSRPTPSNRRWLRLLWTVFALLIAWRFLRFAFGADRPEQA